uniref:Reverse transcriptase domain-containing protein n=1 Tax=Tanacetum cinerariifolium TaxID=118510 RepID=A0A6L2JT67_TANCI|nr:hypothetical protein [Tanacetum cinerariifolium]
MAFVVNSVLANGVDLVLEKEFASFVLQVMKIHPLNQTLSMILQTFSPTLHNPGQAANLSTHTSEPSRRFNSIYYDDDNDDDDEEKTIPLCDIISQLPPSIVITTSPVLPTFEDPEGSLIIGNEDLSTILEKESKEFVKSSVEDLDPIPSESEDTSRSESECDMPFCDDYSSKNEGLDDIASIPQGKEIDHLDAIPNSVQSLLNRANSIIFLIEFLKICSNDDSSPHSPKELNSEIPDAIIESFSPSPISVEDSDSLMEEIDIFLAPDDSIPPGMENDDYDSAGDDLFFKNYLTMILFPFLSMNHFTLIFYNVSSSPRPPEKPPDTLLPFSSENENKVFNPGTLISKEEKSPHLLSHRGFKVFQLINDNKSPMMIYGGDIPILDVPYLHFYPP